MSGVLAFPDDTGIEGVIGLHANDAPSPDAHLENALIEAVKTA
jgi:hypothetical protein